MEGGGRGWRVGVGDGGGGRGYGGWGDIEWVDETIKRLTISSL